MSFKSNRHLHRQQAGIASLLFTLVMMIVISLIVIGFAQLARRGQRETTDSQLSTQAYYAAETAVNDVINLAAVNGGLTPKNDCANSGVYANLNPELDTTNNVSYTCVLVDTGSNNGGLPSIYSNKVGTSQSFVTPITPNSSDTYSLNFAWTAASGSYSLASCPATVNPAAWSCPFSIMRFDLVPVPSGSFSRSDLDNSVMTAFVRPGGSASLANFTATGSGAAQNLTADCTKSADTCSFTLYNLKGDYYLRLLPIYVAPKDVTLTASDDNGTVNLAGSQVIVDATGKAQDVLRRIQVRLPVGAASSGAYPDYALQTTDSICKRFTYNTYPQTIVYPGPNIDPSISANSGPTADDDPLC
jgi:Tfp pilus assembly protein PilX